MRILRSSALLLVLLVFAAFVTGRQALAQGPGRIDPKTEQAVMSAIQGGDFLEAEKLLQSSAKPQDQGSLLTTSPSVTLETSKPSVFEQTMPGNLTQFGYDLFRRAVSTLFSSPQSIPVGPDYIIGPGDQFTLTLWGTTEGIYSITVSKEGYVTLPKVGVISLAGVRFGDLEQTLKRHLSRYYTNVSLSVAMGTLKTYSIYVVGEVENPGSYSLSSLSTVYTALFAAGGPTKLGTLRRVQVLRAGKAIKTVDLYDFLLHGDRSQGIRLQNEDTVFVPLIGPIAGVSGTVYRPAIYEMKGQETIGDMIKIAGGIMPSAFGGRLQVTRYDDNQRKVLLDIVLGEHMPGSAQPAEELSQTVKNMDVVDVKPLYDKVWQTVTLTGDVAYPGEFQWQQDIRVKDIVEEGQLLPTADLRKAEIIRLSPDFRDRLIIPCDLDAAMKDDEAQNMLLQPKDQIRVYSLYRKTETIVLSGEIMRPGTFEIRRGERLSDILRRAGGFTPQAYPYAAVFKRPEIKNAQTKQFNAFMLSMQQRLLQVGVTQQATAISAEEAGIAKQQVAVTQQLVDNLKRQQELSEGRLALNLTPDIDAWTGSKDDPILKDGDSFFVPQESQDVTVLGEVYNPGAVIFQPDRKVMDYIGVAGGYTDFAKEKDTFILQANGLAVSRESLPKGDIADLKLRPGDTVLVPQNLEPHAVMRNTKDIVDILFKTAVVIATITILF
jgi:polysaccharide export outer membrane protein